MERESSKDRIARERKESLARQRKTREQGKIRRQIREAEKAELSRASGTSERREIKRKYGEVYDVALAYEAPDNKEEISTATNDTTGVDSFSLSEPESSGGGGLPDGYEETSVILCENGSPVNGSILFKED